MNIALDTPEAKVVLAALTKAKALGAPGSPLRALVGYLEGCRSITEAVARCRQLQGR